MTPGRRAVAAAVLAVLVVALVGGGLLFLLRRDDETAAPVGPLASVLAGARPASAPFAGLTEVRLDVGGDCRRVVVADSVDVRATGLMRRRDLGPYAGMLFVFDRPTTSFFTMSDVPVPLDIGWYDATGEPVDRTLMQPCPQRSPAECPVYQSKGPYRYALETLGGDLPSGAIGACP
ncbi:MAG TPA: DUF192 domain-containing protein [Acidimicrobiia bacterium]|nr:DUF192 domain-containing protein [Acidimicrobiia bacterium]